MGTENEYYALTKKAFDLLAPFYNLMTLPLIYVRNQLVAISNVDKGSKVLDVATGTGQQAFALHDMPLNIREKALKEMVRVTKPKGVISIVDYGLPHNKMSRALIYHFITLYESEYYKRFIDSDLDSLLHEVGIEVIERVSVLLCAVRILKGIKNTVGEQRSQCDIRHKPFGA